jgi:hypothetical protein
MVLLSAATRRDAFQLAIFFSDDLIIAKKNVSILSTFQVSTRI